MSWTDSHVERWVSALAAVGFSTPNDELGPVPADAFGALEARIVAEHLDGLLIHAVQRGGIELDAAQVQVVAARASRVDGAVVALGAGRARRPERYWTPPGSVTCC